MGTASPHKSMGAVSLHKSMGAVSLHKSMGAASLHKSMDAVCLHKSMGAAALHKLMGAAALHKSMGATFQWLPASRVLFLPIPQMLIYKRISLELDLSGCVCGLNVRKRRCNTNGSTSRRKTVRSEGSPW